MPPALRLQSALQPVIAPRCNSSACVPTQPAAPSVANCTPLLSTAIYSPRRQRHCAYARKSILQLTPSVAKVAAGGNCAYNFMSTRGIGHQWQPAPATSVTLCSLAVSGPCSLRHPWQLPPFGISCTRQPTPSVANMETTNNRHRQWQLHPHSGPSTVRNPIPSSRSASNSCHLWHRLHAPHQRLHAQRYRIR